MDDIAVRADVSKQTVYSHFGSKEHLFLSIVQSITAAANAGFEPVVPEMDTIDDLRRWLVDFAVAQLSVVLTPDIARIRRLAISELGSFPDFARFFYDAGPNRTVELIAPVLAAAHALDIIAVVDPERAARDYNWLLMSEAIMRSLLLGEDASPAPAWIVEHAEATVDTILRAHRRFDRTL